MGEKELKAGMKVFLDGKEVGVLVNSLNKGRFMVSGVSDWDIDLYLFCITHFGRVEIR